MTDQAMIPNQTGPLAGLGNFGRLPPEVRMMIWEKLLPEPNSRVGITWWSCVRRHFPTEILQVSRQINAEASYAFRRTANLFVRVVGDYGSIFRLLPMFGITPNTNSAFVNSRIELSIDFPTYDGKCFAGLVSQGNGTCPHCSCAWHGFVFDIHIRELSRLARLIRFLALSIDEDLDENQIEGPLTKLKLRLRNEPAGADNTLSRDEVRQAVWPFRRLLQPTVDFQVELPEGHEAIPDSEWFWNHRRDTLDCEELLYEVVNLANYLTAKADCKLYINQYSDALLLYRMLQLFLDKQANRPAVAEYLDDAGDTEEADEAENIAVRNFDLMYRHCSDGILIARLLKVRPNPRSSRPPRTFLRELFEEDYLRTPVRSFCFALAFASQRSRREVLMARRIIGGTIEEYEEEEDEWNFPPTLKGLFNRALDLLNRLDGPRGFTDSDERQLWALIPQNRDMIIMNARGVSWQMDDEIAL